MPGVSLAPPLCPDEAPPRPLSRAQLERYVCELARQPDRWLAHVAHDVARRRFVRLEAPPEVEVWLVCWMPGHDTGWHDHGRSCGAVTVVAGAVREQRLVGDDPPASAELVSGSTFTFTPEVVHRVTHHGDAPAVTLHAYSPPLDGSSAYMVDDRGAWRRRPVEAGAELRPL